MSPNIARPRYRVAMIFCVICSCHRFQHPQPQPDAEQHQFFISDYTKELENLQVFSLTSLAVLLAVLAISGSKRLQSVILALVIFIISLRLTVHTCFLQTHPTLSLYLHAVPLLTISCMAGVELTLDASPAVAVFMLVLSVLPLATVIFHRGRHCADTSTALPIRVQEAPVIASSFAVSGSNQV